MLYFDFETTNHSKGSALDVRNRVLMVSWAEDNGVVKLYAGDIMNATGFWRALDRHAHTCAFNAKFEMHWLKRCGFDVDTKHWHDPMLAEKVLLGNRQLPLNLGDVSERYGYEAKDPLIDSMMKAGVCPSQMPQKRLSARCKRDVRTTRAIHQKQMRTLDRQEQVHLYRNRCDFSVVLTHIEASGMHLDRVRVYQQYEKYCAHKYRLQIELDQMTGGINLRSSDQVAEFLYGKLKFPEKRGANRRPLRNKSSKRWPDGKPKTDKATMQWLATQAKTEEQTKFIELRQEYSKANAALTKNLEFFVGVCDERDGWFNAQFNQTVAATHRLTSSGLPLLFGGYDKPKSVQFQNMPREFKPCFAAPEGYVIAEVDAMQLEFRVAAFLGQDERAIEDINDPDFDAHCRTAAVMNDVPYRLFLAQYREGNALRKLQRTGGKPDTFKPLYGGTRGSPEQERYYKAFNDRYSGIVREQENWLAGVALDGKHTTAWGMRFEWETYTNRRGLLMNKKTYKPVGPQVFNYPVQNLATAEIVPIAIVALYKRCKEMNVDVKFVNTVHDSVICYVQEDNVNVELFKRCAEKAFTKAVYEHLEVFYGIEFNVPLGMEMVVGDHWSEGRETVYDDVNNWKDKVA